MAPPLPDALLAAWTATRYMFAARGTLYEARLGQRNLAIEAFLTEQAADSGVFISAFNPGLPEPGRPAPDTYPLLSPEENAARLEQLWAFLGQAGVSWFPHVGLPDAPDWPPEEGAFIIEQAGFNILTLARRLRQRAYVRLRRDQSAVLIPVSPEE